jgi:hypothetical protein
MSDRQVKCNKCGYVGNESEFPKGYDFLQQPYIKRCPKPDCDNWQSPGGASMRMMPGREHPFSYVRPQAADTPFDQTMHNASEAS